MMTSHERILAVLNRETPDRVPVDVWLTGEALDSLCTHTGLSDALEVYRALGVDKMVWVFPGYGTDAFDPNRSRDRDAWGVPTLQVRSGQATYQEYCRGPLADFEDIAELDDYPYWPDPAGFNLPAARQLAMRAREFEFATIGPWISHFEVYCHLRGMENAMMDVVAEPEFLEAALDRIEKIQSEMLERFLAEMGDLLDVVFISDDLGSQESQLISTAAFLTHLKPRIARWCAQIHRHGKKVMFHTDGAARAFLPHLVDCGVDILNPIQHICPGMDRDELKRDFGEKFVFHGGVENQYVLPRGTVGEVRAEVETCLRSLGKGGGYIPSSCHNIQAGTPVENILAMIETVHTWRG